MRRLFTFLSCAALGIAAMGCSATMLSGALESVDQTGPELVDTVVNPNVVAHLAAPSTVAFGSTFDVLLIVKNYGRAKAFHLNATLTLAGGLTTPAQYISIGTLGVGEAKSIAIKLTAPGDMTLSETAMSAALTYKYFHAGSWNSYTSSAARISIALHPVDAALVTVSLSSPYDSVVAGTVTVYDQYGVSMMSQVTEANMAEFYLKPGYYSFAGTGVNFISTTLYGRKNLVYVGRDDMAVRVWICGHQHATQCEVRNNGLL